MSVWRERKRQAMREKRLREELEAKRMQNELAKPITFPTPGQWQAFSQGLISTSVAMEAMGAAAKPKPIKDLGTSIEPIVGYRSWTVRRDGDENWCLGSLTAKSCVWTPGEALEAICHRHEMTYTGYVTLGTSPLGYPAKAASDPDDLTSYTHDAPAGSCSCGVYAMRDQFGGTNVRGVWGEVNLWGRVIICETGYRAEYAYPKSLNIVGVAPKFARRAAANIQERYGIPVEVLG